MDRDRRKSRYQRQNPDEIAKGSRRRSRGGYEEDYTPHYSSQNRQNNQNNYTASSAGSENRFRVKRSSDAYRDQSFAGEKTHRKMPDPRNEMGGDFSGKQKGNHKKKHMVGRVLAIIQGGLSIVVLGFLLLLDILPIRYIAIAAVLLLILWVFAYFSQFTRGTHIAGKVESVILCVVLAVGSYYLFVTNSFLGAITGTTTQVDNIVIAVLADDPAQTLADAADYTFGIQTTIDRENVDKTIEQINENLGKEITTAGYDGIQAQINALYNGEVGAIIYNEAFNGNIVEEFPTFNDDIRVLDNVKIETQVQVAASDKKVTKEPFTIYISGNDAYGTISSNGRSDVNILATVNQETKQIILTTTPRDYYVEFPGVTNGQLDKLTHAGIYGVDCSMRTLEEIYGINIDYYVKVNFTSLVNIVDQLGGVEVYSDYSFTSFDGKTFQQGYNYMDGETALSFARERKSLAGGDNQRGKNQQAVLTALIQKAMSPAILTNYTGLLSSLTGNFETNMSMNDITELIKMQLDDGSEWNIVSQSVVGSDGNDYCYSLNDTAYVMIPDQASVQAASDKINQVLNGQVVSTDDASETETQPAY